MRSYELVVILRPDRDPTALFSRIEKLIKEFKGKVVKKKEWGKRLLSYEIKKQREAFYAFFELELTSAQVEKLEDFLKVEEDVLRHLLVKLEDQTPGKEAEVK